MKKFSIGKKLISIFLIMLLFLQYMAVPQYATAEEGSFTEEEFPYDICCKDICTWNKTSVAVDEEGDLWMWGNCGQFSDNKTPIRIVENKKFVKAVMVGLQCINALDEDGNLWFVRYHEIRMFETDAKFTQIVNGKNNFFALVDNEGNLWTGNLDETANKVSNGVKIEQIDMGDNCVLAVDEDGDLWRYDLNIVEDGSIIPLENSEIGKIDLDFKIKSISGFGDFDDMTAVIDIDGNLLILKDNSFVNISEQKENTKFKSVSSGKYFISAIDEDGNLWNYKRTNNYSNEQIEEITKLETDIKFNDISNCKYSTEGNHSEAIDQNGNIWAWGNNLSGNLGNDATTHSDIPIQVTDFNGFKVIFKNYDGEVLEEKWVRNTNDATYTGEVPEKYREGYTCIFSGWDKSLENIIENTEFIAQYNEIKNVYKLTVIPEKKVFDGEYESSIDVTAKEGFTLTYNYGGNGQESTSERKSFEKWVLTNTQKEDAFGSISNENTLTTTYTYGAGNDILTAIYNEVILPTPEPREGYIFGGWYTAASCIKRTRVGDAGDSYAITKDTTLYAKWKKDTAEELEPEYKVSSGNKHSAWIDEEGKLWMWGSNEYGQVGNGEENNDIIIPTLIKEDITFNQVSLGDDFSGAIDEEGNLWMWGRNTYGQLGTGSTDDSLVPINISELMNNKKFINLSLGGYTSAAIDEEGNLYTWGSNLYGELGNGTTNDSYSPTQILQDEDICFIQVSIGDSFVSAIDESGKIWTWGSNIYGQLGNGTVTDSTEPNLIMPEKVFKHISLGKDTAGAIDIDGNLWMWGRNTYGQLGNGTTDDSNIPIQIMNGTKFISLGIGNLHSVAVDEEGNLYAWGINESYQIGNETTEDSSVPVKLETNNTQFIQVEAGDSHTIAIDKDKDAWTWGDNNYHQLGYDGEGKKPTPISKRKVIFKNYDGTVLEEKWVKYGSDVTYTGTTPKKEVEGFHYRFDGWDKSLEMVTTNMVYTAQFVESQVTYELTLNPGAQKYEGDVGETKLVTAPQITVVLNYNGSGQENQEIKPQFNRWTLKNSNEQRANGSITNTWVNPITYTFGEGNDVLTASYRPIILPKPTREKYEFGGWYAHETCQEINRVSDGGVLFTPRTTITLYAKWIKITEKLYLTSDTYKFQINDPIEDEKTGEIIEQKSYIYRINPNTTLTELLENLDTNGEVTVYNKAGNVLRPYDIVGTGMTLVDIGDDRTITLTLSVKGDPSGEGEVTATDLTVMNQQLLKEFDLSDERFLSLDISDDGKITATDLAAIKQVLLKELDLSTIE